MKTLIVWWLRRKLARLEAKLAGRQAALDELRRYGQGNWGIAEDIGVLKYRIGKVKARLEVFA